jgi:hypothetical protein
MDKRGNYVPKRYTLHLSQILVHEAINKFPSLFDIYMSKGDYIIVRRCAPYRQIVTSELVRLLFALTLEHVT